MIYYCILGLAEIKKNFASQGQNYAIKIQDLQVTKSLNMKFAHKALSC